MPTKGVLFSESVWNGRVFHCKKIWEGVQRFKYICLERDSCLSGKGVVNYLRLIRGYHKWSFVYDVKRQRKTKSGLHKCTSFNPSFHFVAPLGTRDYYQRTQLQLYLVKIKTLYIS